MTTTNVYQGLAGEKNSSRVLQAPGGSSNIFGHYQEESDRELAQKKQQEMDAVVQSIAKGNSANGDVSHNFHDSKDSYAANRQRNHGDGAPFAVGLPGEAVKVEKHRQLHTSDTDTQSAKEQQIANRTRNHGQGAPFALGDGEEQAGQGERPAQHQQTIGDDYLTPKQRQANNPNKAANSFNNLFGDSGPDTPSSKAHGKVSTHNPVTWEAYSNFDAAQDHPQHRSRFENFASAKAGTFNPITGEDHVTGQQPSTKVQAPPGGKSSIQF